MFPDLLPLDAIHLSEDTSIALAQKITAQPIAVPFSDRPISTTYIGQGEECQREDSPPILLLHGFDSSIFEFRRLLPLLGLSSQAFVVDLLGFGFTERRLDIPFDTDAIKIHLHAFWHTVIGQPVI